MFRISGFSFLGKRIGAENNAERNAIPEQINCEAAPTSEVKTLLIYFIHNRPTIHLSPSIFHLKIAVARKCGTGAHGRGIFVEAKDIFYCFSVEVTRNENSRNRARKRFIAKDSNAMQNACKYGGRVGAVIIANEQKLLASINSL